MRSQPLPPQVLRNGSNFGRNVAIGGVGLIIVAGVLALIASQRPVSEPSLKWSVDGGGTTLSSVGGTVKIGMSVTNNGPKASNLVIYLNAKDNWFKHHVITGAGGCSIDNDLERLLCGPLNAGETGGVLIVGSPKDAGTFYFAEDAADQENGTLLHPKLGEITWSEIVLPR